MVVNLQEFLKKYGYKFYKIINLCDKYKSELYLNNKNLLIIDLYFDYDKDNLFSYGLYCDQQNKLMLDYDNVFRFNYLDLESFKKDFLMILKSETIDIDSYSKVNRNEYYIDNSMAEKKFEDIFVDTFGNDGLNYLHKEEAISSLNGNSYFIDFALDTSDGCYAFEANGISFHHPLIIGKEAYNNQLLKQNMLMLLGYKTFRFSTENLEFKDKMVDILKVISKKDKFINKALLKGERKFKLYEHQENILKKLDEDRLNNINTSLIVLPTGTGKSQIIIEDLTKKYIKDNINNILILVPTLRIKKDWLERIKDIDNFNIKVLTYISAYKEMYSKGNNYYDYIVFDEAHHAMSNNNKKMLSYYNPKYLIGLTATPSRLDMQKLETIFGMYDINLSLEEAIKRDVIVNIRCFRLISNVNLSDVRFNGKDYYYSDLERSLIIDSRNQLIVDTIIKYFKASANYFKQGIIFCVNKEHTIKLAKMLNDSGILAAAVYGNNKDNDKIFSDYRDKKIQFLCSCELISEGFDSPQTEVVVMARPTLSKTLYMQQIGRGTRKYPGKDCLYVIDVVDNYDSTLTPWSFNSLFNLNYYHDFIGVLDKKNREYLNIFGLNEYELKLEEININTFESLYDGYYSLEEAARILFIGTETLKKWNSDKKYSSLSLTVGNRLVPYFNDEDIKKIIEEKNLKEHTEETILEDFLDFIDENNLTYSFKLVFLLSCFKLVNEQGEINLTALVEEYRKFYLNRIKLNLKVEKKSCIYTYEYLNDMSKIKNNMLTNPFEKYERKRFLYLSKDLNVISFNMALWNKLDESIIEKIIEKEEKFLKEYYERFVDIDE